MGEIGLLTPREAEAVIDDRIEQFGLGALPTLRSPSWPMGPGGCAGSIWRARSHP